MNDTEELLRLVLREHAENAPTLEDLRLEQPTRAGKWGWLLPVSVALVTATVILGVWSVSEWQGNKRETASVTGPDLTGVLFGVLDGSRAHLYSTDSDGDASRVSTSDMEMYYADWSPDGTQIAFIGGEPSDSPDLYVMAPDGTGITRVLHTPGVIEGDATWSADGSSIYFWQSHSDGTWSVKKIDLASGSVTTIPNTGRGGGIAVSPDGSQVAIVRNTGGPVSLFVLSTTDGSVIEEIPHISSGPAWSPDGERLAYGDEQGHLILRDLASGSTQTLDTPSGSPNIQEVAWGPDENYLIARTDSIRRNDIEDLGAASAIPDDQTQLFVVNLSTGTFQPLTLGISAGEISGGVTWGKPQRSVG